jgi:uncharacterized membrane protein YeaQ/YmgE (transglycosylase-associated protein family)
MWFIITSLLCGFVAGLIARALVSGPGPSGCLPTTALGLVGSFVGGFLGYVIFGVDLDEGAFQPAGLFGSIVGAVIALLVYRARARR